MARRDDLASSLAEGFTRGAVLMLEAREDVVAFRQILRPQWKKPWAPSCSTA